MNARAPDAIPPPSEHRAAARRKRLFQLQRIVWELMFERFRKVTLRDYDDSENADLIAALRACSLYIEQIEFIGWLEPLVFHINGVDGHEYIINFELMESGFRLFSARGESNFLTLDTEKWGHENFKQTTFREKAGFVEEVTLGDVTVDRAFLVGMSMVIGLMDPRGDDEDDRLMPLVKQITPTTEELDAIASKAPSPTVVLDDDDPY